MYKILEVDYENLKIILKLYYFKVEQEDIIIYVV